MVPNNQSIQLDVMLHQNCWFVLFFLDGQVKSFMQQRDLLTSFDLIETIASSVTYAETIGDIEIGRPANCICAKVVIERLD